MRRGGRQVSPLLTAVDCSDTRQTLIQLSALHSLCSEILFPIRARPPNVTSWKYDSADVLCQKPFSRWLSSRHCSKARAICQLEASDPWKLWHRVWETMADVAVLHLILTKRLVPIASKIQLLAISNLVPASVKGIRLPDNFSLRSLAELPLQLLLKSFPSPCPNAILPEELSWNH